MTMMVPNETASHSLPVYVRRRGTALIETEAGILIVQESDGVFSLPGGGVELGETPQDAVIREMREETGLEVVSMEFLFDHFGTLNRRRTNPRQMIQSHHHVFLVATRGIPQPSDGIQQIRYYRQGDNLSLASSAYLIIGKYWAMQRAQAG